MSVEYRCDGCGAPIRGHHLAVQVRTEGGGIMASDSCGEGTFHLHRRQSCAVAWLAKKFDGGV